MPLFRVELQKSNGVGEEPSVLICQVLARTEDRAEEKARAHWGAEVPDLDDYMLTDCADLED